MEKFLQPKGIYTFTKKMVANKWDDGKRASRIATHFSARKQCTTVMVPTMATVTTAIRKMCYAHILTRFFCSWDSFAMLNNRIINFLRTNQSVSTAIQIACFVYIWWGDLDFSVMGRHTFTLVSFALIHFGVAHVFTCSSLNLSTEKLLRLHKND